MFWWAPLFVAPFVGSVVGVLIRRLPAGRPVALSRSACESCVTALTPVDLVPLVSFICFGGRCRLCGAPIARFHLAVELAAILVAAVAVNVDADTPRVWADCGLGWCLLALGWIDAEHQILPDVLTLPLLVAGLGVTCWLTPAAVSVHAFGAVAGYTGFRGIEISYRWLRGRDGLGQGDAKLLAAGGAWIGVQAIPELVFLAALAGILMALVLRWYDNRSIATPVPFGPPLAIMIFFIQLTSQV